MQLTEKTIADLPVTGRRYSKSDSGLAIEVTAAGSKTFIFWDRKRKYTIGPWPEWSLKDARAEFHKRKGELAEKPADDTAKGRMTFREFVEGPYRDRGMAKHKDPDLTLEFLDRVFLRQLPRIADMQLRKITVEDIESLNVDLVNHYPSPSTAKRELSRLKAVLSKAAKWKYIPESPAVDVEPPVVDRTATKLYLTDGELKRLSAALAEWKTQGELFGTGFEPQYGRGFFGNAHPLWFYVLVKIYINTGLRKSEGLALKWGDIDFDENVLTVRGTGAKSRQTRPVPLTPELIEVLTEFYRSEHEIEFEGGDPDRETAIEPDPDERLFNVKSIRKPWERLRKLAKLDARFTPHLLRHNFCSYHANVLNTNLLHIQKIAGHADLATTQRYLSSHLSDLKAAQAVSIG